MPNTVKKSNTTMCFSSPALTQYLKDWETIPLFLKGKRHRDPV